MQGWKSLGSEVWYKTHTCSHQEGSSGALIRFGGGEDDRYDHATACVGGVSWCSECKGPTWDLISLDPLHIEPSVRTNCHKHPEHHGFIREGKWESA